MTYLKNKKMPDPQSVNGCAQWGLGTLSKMIGINRYED
jgi:hypothetical protein